MAKRKITLVNPGAQHWTSGRYVLWVGMIAPNFYLIYADSLEDAMAELGDYLADYDPGMLFSPEEINEEYESAIQDLADEYDLSPEEVRMNDRLAEIAFDEATTDLTLLGDNHWIHGDEWGIVAENPSDKELIAIAQGGR